MRSLSTSPLFLVLKVMIYSAIASAAVKFGLPLLPAFAAIAAHDLSIATMDRIAIGAITIPVAMFALVLWFRR